MNVGRYLRGEDLHVGTSRITKPKELKMNERIKELKQQARDFYLLQEDLDCSTKELHELVEQKFAELIIRECLDIIKHNICEPEYRGGSQILESYENYQANRRLEDILNQIQKHFGVEE